MKFGVSVSKNRVKIFKCDHCVLLTVFSCSTLCRTDAVPASGHRRATPRVGNRTPTPLKLSLIVSQRRLRVPHPLSLPRAAAAQSTSSSSPPSVPPANSHHPASFPRTRSRATSPRTYSAPPQARSSCFPTESSVSVAATIAVLVELRPLSVEPLLRPSSASKSVRGELPRNPLLLPGLFSPCFRGLRHRNVAAPL